MQRRQWPPASQSVDSDSYKCGNCEAGTLIDSGATHNFASADWIRKAELTTIDDGDEF